MFYQFIKTRNFRAGSRISRSASKLRVLSIIKHAIRKIEKSHKKLRVLSIYLRIAYIAFMRELRRLRVLLRVEQTRMRSIRVRLHERSE